MTGLAALLAFAGAYALGCFVAAYYAVRWRTGSDLREVGSGNTGARNSARVLGRGWGIAIAFLDIAKGALAVLVARELGASELVQLAAAFGVAVGHIWPAQLSFRGGKGAAAALGAVLAMDPRTALTTVAVIVVLAFLLRDTKRAGLIAFAATPLIAVLSAHSPESAGAASGLALLLLWTHRRDWLSVERTPISQPTTAKTPRAS